MITTKRAKKIGTKKVPSHKEKGKTKIIYPKTEVTVLEQPKQKVAVETSQQKQQDLEQEIDELKTKSNNLPQIDTSSLQPKLTAGDNISITNNVISATVPQIDTTNLQAKLTAGQNISISNNEISATDTTYTAGNNIAISANNVISATDTKYTAGTNISISNQNVISATDTTYSAGTNVTIDQNNVISASCVMAGQEDLAELHQQISALQREVGILNGTFDENKLSGAFEPHATGEVFRTYDCFERDITFTSTNKIYGYPVNFVSHYQAAENDEPVLANINFIFEITPSQSAGTISLVVQDNSTLVDTLTATITSDMLGTKQTITWSLTNYNCTTSNHVLYTYLSIPTGMQVQSHHQKVQIFAPNATVCNNISNFDVYYDPYYEKYFLSDCSGGTAKVCEINKSDLHKTSDIVWTDTGIVAEKYFAFFNSDADPQDNTKFIPAQKYFVTVKKDRTTTIDDGNSNSTMYSGCYDLSHTLIRGKNITCLTTTWSSGAMLFNERILKPNLSPFYNYDINNGTNHLFRQVQHTNTNFYNSATIDKSTVAINYNGMVGMMHNNYSDITTSDIYFGRNPKLYQVNATNTYNYIMIFEYDGIHYKLPILKSRYSLTYGTPTKLGSYQEYFLGADDDYFCVVNNKLYYYKN